MHKIYIMLFICFLDVLGVDVASCFLLLFFFHFVDLCVCRFINYCVEEEGYTGYDISNLEETEAVVERLLALNIHEEIIGKT